MFQKALAVLEKYRGKRLAVGVSGGADSMCLLYLIFSCGFFDKADITVLHVDHNLRATAKRDRKLVEDFCAQNGIKIKVFSVDVNAAAQSNKRSIETEARIIRHKLFNDFCTQSGTELVLAHTRDDQAETVLMHIFRGAGLNGLKGMSERDGHIIRPLIYNSKAQIYEYNAVNGIPFFEDETNADTKYSRNYIRELLKSVQTVYPAASDNIALLSLLARDAADIICSQLNHDYFSADQDAVLLDRAALKTPHYAYYIMSATQQAGLSYDLEYKHIEAVKALSDKPAGVCIHLPHAVTAYGEREKIAFSKRTESDQNFAEIAFCEGENIIGAVTVAAVPAENRVKKGSITVDADCLSGAVLRFRKDGDRFCPCGGKTKKLKEYLNEKHIPNRKKDTIPLICRGDEVLVIAGIELSDKVKLTDATQKALEIRVL